MTTRPYDVPPPTPGPGPVSAATPEDAAVCLTFEGGTPSGEADPIGSGPRLTAIAAVAANGVIGDGHTLLWHLPEDFARFKRVTLGGVLIMGRRTFDSLGGALPGRQTIVLSRSTGPGIVWSPLGSDVSGGLATGSDLVDDRHFQDGRRRAAPSAATDLATLLAGATCPIEVDGGHLVPPAGGVPDFGAGVYVVGKPDLAIRLLPWYPGRAWWSSGGGEVYALLWPYTTDLDLTEVHSSPAGAVTFPVVDPVYFTETRRQPRSEFDFVGYTRRTLDARQRLSEAIATV